MELWRKELYHYGIEGQHWGVRRGPPYPLDARSRSYGVRPKSFNGTAGNLRKISSNNRKKLVMALKVGGLAVAAGAAVYGGYRLGSLSKAKELGEMALKKAMAENDLKSAVSELENIRKKLAKTETDAEPFRETLDTYKKYSELKLASKEPWKSVLPSDNPVHFLMAGAKANSIMGLWDTMKNEGLYAGSKEYDALMDTMRFLIDQYNSTLDTPVWKLSSDQPGMRFNESLHVRGPGSSQHSGTIQEVLFPGILNTATNKVVRKAVVVSK